MKRLLIVIGLIALITSGLILRNQTQASAPTTLYTYLPIVLSGNNVNTDFELCNFVSWEPETNALNATMTITTTNSHTGKCSAYYQNNALDTQAIYHLAHDRFQVQPGQHWAVSGWANLVNTGNYGVVGLVVDWYDEQDGLVDEYQVGWLEGAVGWFKLCSQIILPDGTLACPPFTVPERAVSAQPTWIFVKDFEERLRAYVDDLQFTLVP